MIHDERNPPPVDTLDALNASIGHMNGAPLEERGEQSDYEAHEPLKIIDPTRWMNQLVPERQWVVPGLIPLHNVTLLAGDGGLGKSILVMLLMAACALGKRWLGYPTKNCRAFGFFCEDDEDELHRRMVDICRYYKVELADLVGLELCSRVGLDNSLMDWRDAWETGETSWLHAQIMKNAVETATQLVVLDSHHDVFVGEENWRRHGRQFCQGLREIALKIDGAVVMTAHPSLSGRSSGTGESMMTIAIMAWRSSIRCWALATSAELTAPLRVRRSRRCGTLISLASRQGLFQARMPRRIRVRQRPPRHPGACRWRPAGP